jgi:ketosteroid isomerase-like protein
MNDSEIMRFTALEDAFNQAMVSNDVTQIAQCISDDWVLVTPERGPISREAILGIIANGTLSHDMMKKQIERVKVYGDMALVTGRGQNTGHFMGQPIKADEWITDVYHRVGETWLCVLTHLAPAVT